MRLYLNGFSSDSRVAARGSLYEIPARPRSPAVGALTSFLAVQSPSRCIPHESRTTVTTDTQNSTVTPVTDVTHSMERVPTTGQAAT